MKEEKMTISRFSAEETDRLVPDRNLPGSGIHNIFGVMTLLPCEYHLFYLCYS